MLIAFVIDTSASMNQRTNSGLTLLDVARFTVDHFIRTRGRDSKSDRYMLITCDENGTDNILCGWKSVPAVFQREVASLRARDLTAIGKALSSTFELLNLTRIARNVDTYGLGLHPWWIDPAAVILMTDGGVLTSNTGVVDKLSLPLGTSVGAELTQQPFRWDQRLYSVSLRISGTEEACPPPDADTLPITKLCEQTGGRSHVATSIKAAMSIMETLAQRLQPGVLMDFVGPPQFTSPHRLLIVPPDSRPYFWPLPEAYVLNPSVQTLPQRQAHPQLTVAPKESPTPSSLLPHDTFEIASCSLTNQIYSASVHIPHDVCWFVAVHIPSVGRLSAPCGYLRYNLDLKRVFLHVLPYDFPVLLPLLEEIITAIGGTAHVRAAAAAITANADPSFAPHVLPPIPPPLRHRLDMYIDSIPPYYLQPLRKTLIRLGLNPIPDRPDRPDMSPKIKTYFAQIQQQNQTDSDKLLAAIAQRSPALPPGSLSNANPTTTTITTTAAAAPSPTPTGAAGAAGTATPSDPAATVAPTVPSTRPYYNAFDIPRDQLVAQLQRIRVRLSGSRSTTDGSDPASDLERRNRVPIADMGNYHEALMRNKPLRDVNDDESQPRHIFGNPFRSDGNGKRRGGGARIDALLDDAASDGEGALNLELGGAGGKRNSRRRHSFSGASTAPANGGASESDQPPQQDPAQQQQHQHHKLQRSHSLSPSDLRRSADVIDLTDDDEELSKPQHEVMPTEPNVTDLPDVDPAPIGSRSNSGGRSDSSRGDGNSASESAKTPVEVVESVPRATPQVTVAAETVAKQDPSATNASGGDAVTARWRQSFQKSTRSESDEEEDGDDTVGSHTMYVGELDDDDDDEEEEEDDLGGGSLLVQQPEPTQESGLFELDASSEEEESDESDEEERPKKTKESAKAMVVDEEEDEEEESESDNDDEMLAVSRRKRPARRQQEEEEEEAEEENQGRRRKRARVEKAPMKTTGVGRQAVAAKKPTKRQKAAAAQAMAQKEKEGEAEDDDDDDGEIDVETVDPPQEVVRRKPGRPSNREIAEVNSKIKKAVDQELARTTTRTAHLTSQIDKLKMSKPERTAYIHTLISRTRADGKNSVSGHLSEFLKKYL